MKKHGLRRVAAVVLSAAVLLGAGSLFSACAQKAETLASLEGNKITANMYRFMLSRAKGNLGGQGYSVDSVKFWSAIVDSNNTTYDEFIRQESLSNLRAYLAALAIFDEMDLSLPQSEYDRIDKEIAEYLATAGSKSALNTELAAFGVNMDMLREIYVIEAKVEYVRDTIYGEDGSLVAASVRQEYLQKNAVAFRHVLIRSFDYVYETDADGNDIYYLTGQNNAKVNNIAYDKENGTVRPDSNGTVMKDANGDTIYFLENGHIAYDKENGVRAYTYDKDGIVVTKTLSEAALAGRRAEAEEILSLVAKGDYAAFEALLDEYAIDEDDCFETDGELAFLYTTGDNGTDYLNDIADTIAEAEVGEVKMIYSSEYGYNVVMRYEIPEDAATNSTYEEWFEGLPDRVVSELFYQKCKPYMERVEVDEAVFAALPSMTEIGANYYY